jgi:hypothetical protein
MQKDTPSEKNDPAFDGCASDLKRAQQGRAADLLKSQAKTAHELETDNEKNATDLLINDGKIRETPEDARQYAAVTLATTQHKAAAMLKNSQSSAAKALNDSQTEAASALRTSHLNAKDKHDDKDKTISWLSGDYSVSGKRD